MIAATVPADVPTERETTCQMIGTENLVEPIPCGKPAQYLWADTRVCGSCALDLIAHHDCTRAELAEIGAAS